MRRALNGKNATSPASPASVCRAGSTRLAAESSSETAPAGRFSLCCVESQSPNRRQNLSIFLQSQVPHPPSGGNAMRQPSQSIETKGWHTGGEAKAGVARETDPLLQSSTGTHSRTWESHTASTIRSRHSSRSPTVSVNQHFGSGERQPNDQMSATYGNDTPDQEIQKAYNILPDETSRSGNLSLGENSRTSAASAQSAGSAQPLRRQVMTQKDGPEGEHPPLLEIPEEIYGVRKAALQVLKPLTRTWMVVSIGFTLTVLFGMARWTGLLPDLPFWLILFPTWLSHVGLFWCHLLSAKALSTFIVEANDSRQRPDSRDHLDRTEYLPLLQRSLKFGLKTGLISFGIFIFEILMYFRLARGKLSLAVVFLPLWIMVVGGILDGIICKSQHPLRVVCWLLAFAAMILACLRVDYGFDSIRWRMVVSPIVAILTVSSATLIYIVYGHQVGYYRLTEAQLTAGNLYSLAALICIVLVVVVGEVMPLARPVEIETRVFVVLMAPLVVTLVGMGAWVVSRDEFGRLLIYGGQAAVHPRKLRWEEQGWTSVQGRGVTAIPMFGEVSFCPLEKQNESNVELCMCCTCYPREDSDDEAVDYVEDQHGQPYLAPQADDNQHSHLAALQRQQDVAQSTQHV